MFPHNKSVGIVILKNTFFSYDPKKSTETYFKSDKDELDKSTFGAEFQLVTIVIM